LQGKLRELVEVDTVEAANRQKQSHGRNESLALQVGQEVLLNNSTKSKLEPRWTGPWVVREWKGPLNVKISMNNKEQIVHVNRVRPLLRADLGTERPKADEQWSPPLFQYYCDESPAPATQDEPPAVPQSGPTRVVRPVERYGY